jgi:hypothetical protein
MRADGPGYPWVPTEKAFHSRTAMCPVTEIRRVSNRICRLWLVIGAWWLCDISRAAWDAEGLSRGAELGNARALHDIFWNLGLPRVTQHAQ